MRKIIKYITLFVALFFVQIAFSQEPPHPDDDLVGGGVENGGPIRNPGGGGVSIAGGVGILLVLGAGYGLKKLYDKRNVSQDI